MNQNPPYFPCLLQGSAALDFPLLGGSRLRFTLIECLTVIFLMGLLLTLLLPALGSSLQTSQAVHCLGNQKQLSYAFQQYSHDHADYLPEGHSRQKPLEHGGTNWACRIMPYLQSTGPLDCPASPDPAPGESPQELHLYDGNYGWNFDGTQGRNGPVFRSIRNCSGTYLLFDSGDQCITYWSNKWESLMEELDLDWDSGKEGCNRHRKLVNISFLDAHGEKRNLNDFLAAPNPSGEPPWHIKWSEPVLQPGKIPFPDR